MRTSGQHAQVTFLRNHEVESKLKLLRRIYIDDTPNWIWHRCGYFLSLGTLLCETIWALMTTFSSCNNLNSWVVFRRNAAELLRFEKNDYIISVCNTNRKETKSSDLLKYSIFSTLKSKIQLCATCLSWICLNPISLAEIFSWVSWYHYNKLINFPFKLVN